MHSARGWLAALGVGTPAEDPVVELVLLLAMSGDYTNGLRQLSAKGYEQAPTSALEVKYLLGENPGIVVMPNHNVPPYCMQYATELKKQTGLQLDTHYYGQVLELTWTPTPINYATVCGLDRELRRQSGIDRSGTLHIVTVLKDPDLSQALLDIPREDMSAEVHEDVPAGKVFKLEVRFYASGAFERQFVKID